MNLRNKTVVVTGAARGIGQAIALRFAEQGAHLALIDMDEAGLEHSRKACESNDITARSYRANVANEAEVSQTMAAIAEDFGHIDVLVNNAGIIRDGLLIKRRDDGSIEQMSLAQWQAVIDVNLTGVFLCGREAAAQMVKAGTAGVIINISSISRHGNAGQSNYAAAKSGVAAMSVVWAKELGRYGIRVAAIAPGFIETDILSSMRPEILEKVLRPVPLARAGQAHEVAHTAQYIVENDYFTGRCVDLDGGLRL